VSFEIAYWGPPISGRSTNLKILAGQFGGELVRASGVLSLRTTIDGETVTMKAIQSPLYQETLYRDFVSRADGIVLVLDAQSWQLAANRFYVELLQRLLREGGKSLADVPSVVQVNKSDTEGALLPAQLLPEIGLAGARTVTAVADSGAGVVETVSDVLGLLKSRRMTVVRPVEEGDVAALLEAQLAIDAESRFMMFEPGERPRDLEDKRRSLTETLAPRNATLLVAVEGPRIIGFAEARGGAYRRNAHAAEIVLGVQADRRGRGVGGRLLAELERWAVARGIVRLELTVMTPNERARRLYERHGFVVEGTKRLALRVDGGLVDELLMAKILERETRD
jgi:RimJ/RimL family protein N-acetyltransferase